MDARGYENVSSSAAIVAPVREKFLSKRALVICGSLLILFAALSVLLYPQTSRTESMTTYSYFMPGFSFTFPNDQTLPGYMGFLNLITPLSVMLLAGVIFFFFIRLFIWAVSVPRSAIAGRWRSFGRLTLAQFSLAYFAFYFLTFFVSTGGIMGNSGTGLLVVLIWALFFPYLIPIPYLITFGIPMLARYFFAKASYYRTIVSVLAWIVAGTFSVLTGLLLYSQSAAPIFGNETDAINIPGEIMYDAVKDPRCYCQGFIRKNYALKNGHSDICYGKLVCDYSQPAPLVPQKASQMVNDSEAVIATEAASIAWVVEDSLTAPYSLFTVDLSFPSPQVGYAISVSGAFDLHKTINGGLDWTALKPSSPDTSFISSISDLYFVSENEGYLIATDSSSEYLLLKTEDGGVTWHKKARLDQYAQKIAFNKAGLGYIAGIDGRIWQSKDGGSSWKVAFSPETRPDSPEHVSLYKIAFIGDGQAYAVGSANFGIQPVVMLTGNNKDWKTFRGVGRLSPRSSYFLNLNNGYIFGTEGEVVKTSDGGATWKNLALDVSEGILGAYFADEQNGFLVTERGTLLETADGGESWTRNKPAAPDAPTETFSDIFIVNGSVHAISASGNVYRLQRK